MKKKDCPSESETEKAKAKSRAKESERESEARQKVYTKFGGVMSQYESWTKVWSSSSSSRSLARPELQPGQIYTLF